MYQYNSIFDDSINLNEIDKFDELSSWSNDDFKQNIFEIPNLNDPKYTWIQNISFATKDKSEYKKPVFRTELLKKQRGRKSQKETKKEKHSSSRYDNIISKIQIHFLNFIIFLLNDCIFSYFKNKKLKFKKFIYSFKSRATNKHLQNLKNSTVYDLLNKVSISEKYKKYKENINQKILEELNKITFFQKIFEIKFLNLFFIYYNKKQICEEIFLFDRKIFLSKQTKTFYDLLQKNKKLEKDIIQITEIAYLDDIKKMELDQRVTDASDEEKFN